MWKDKIKAFLLDLYPELARFQRFAHLIETVPLNLNRRYRPIIRVALPLISTALVLWLGISLGQAISQSIARKSLQLPQPPAISPTPINEYQSPIESLRQEIVNFNPSLPDPLPPVLDNNISL